MDKLKSSDWRNNRTSGDRYRIRIYVWASYAYPYHGLIPRRGNRIEPPIKPHKTYKVLGLSIIAKWY